jgi:phosphoenolpyruvate carboxykinase (ATP)
MNNLNQQWDIASLGLKHRPESTYFQSPLGFLVEQSILHGQGKLIPGGALRVLSGKFTGRAAEDKYIVESPKTKTSIDWDNNIRKLTPAQFQDLKKEVIDSINQGPRLFAKKANVSAESKYALQVELYTNSAHHALFFDHLMRHDDFTKFPLGVFRIYHAPAMLANKSKYGLRSETVIATDFDTNEVLVIGTAYAGEIKKSVFSAMNFILPEMGILPMHAGANAAPNGDVSVFFGLSGTGKTTLSTQEGRALIGDDEHGLSAEGIFNFEGGCYAKMIRLSKENEPDIYEASTKFGAILENVVLKEQNNPDFDDDSIGENTRSSYPLSFVKHIVPNSKGKIPNTMFFLSADAFGVLPPASKLTTSQVMYYFLSGYTAKLAGTEVGVKEPKAAFSTCFGAPFMVRHPSDYANLLGEYVEKYHINVWLINTGWSGGKFGEGKRFPLKITRRIIDAVQNGELKNAKFQTDEVFGLQVPTEVPGVEGKLLNPKATWRDSDAYMQTAKQLAKMFHQNFEKFSQMSAKIKDGAPLYK